MGFKLMWGCWGLLLLLFVGAVGVAMQQQLFGEKHNKSTRKIYFAGSIRGGRQDVTLYRSLIGHIGNKHGIVLTEHVGKAALQSMGEMGTSDSFIYDRDMNWLRSAHAVVAEVTRPSLGVGYEIAYAEQLKLPVLCLYRPEANEHSRLSAMISGSDLVINHEYKNKEDAVRLIDEFFANIDEKGSNWAWTNAKMLTKRN